MLSFQDHNRPASFRQRFGERRRSLSRPDYRDVIVHGSVAAKGVYEPFFVHPRAPGDSDFARPVVQFLFGPRIIRTALASLLRGMLPWIRNGICDSGGLLLAGPFAPQLLVSLVVLNLWTVVLRQFLRLLDVSVLKTLCSCTFNGRFARSVPDEASGRQYVARSVRSLLALLKPTRLHSHMRTAAFLAVQSYAFLACDDSSYMMGRCCARLADRHGETGKVWWASVPRSPYRKRAATTVSPCDSSGAPRRCVCGSVPSVKASASLECT